MSWYDYNWNYRRRITIDNSKVEEDLVDFPVLINISSDSDLALKVRSDGYDILFTSLEGEKLDHEIEKWDKTTGELIAWVRVPFLSSTIDTYLFLYYGNPTAHNQQNKTGVWNSGFVFVSHMDLEETEPSSGVVVYDDSVSDGSWGVSYGGSGGSLGPTGEIVDGENTEQVMLGNYAFKLKVGTGTYTVSRPAINFTTYPDWTGYRYLSFFWYGQNTDDNVDVFAFKNNSPAEWSRYRFYDNFTGYKEVIIDLFDQNLQGADGNGLDEVHSLYFESNIIDTIYIDYVRVYGVGTILYDDDETYWAGAGHGTGSIGVPVLSEETSIKTKGGSSLKAVVGSGSYSSVYAQHSYIASPPDWSIYKYLSIYLYGINDSNTIQVTIYGGGSGGTNASWWNVTDDFAGWRKFYFPLDDFDVEGGDWDITDIRLLQIRWHSTGTRYVDHVTLINPPEIILDDINWSPYNGGSGSYEITLSDEQTIIRSGRSSTKGVISSGSYSAVGWTYSFTHNMDWSAFEYAGFWFYGSNSGMTFWFHIFDSSNNQDRWDVVDNFTGWRQIVLPLNDPDDSYGLDITDVDRVFLDVTPTQTGTWYIDRLVLGVFSIDDSTSYGNDGVPTDVKSRGGEIGRASYFDGDGDWIVVPDDSSLRLDSFTVSFAWDKEDSGVQIFFRKSGSVNYNYYAYEQSNWLYFSLYDEGGGNHSADVADLGAGWHYYSFAYDGASLKIYGDGDVIKKVDDVFDPNSDAGTDLYIGTHSLGYTFPLIGEMDEFRISSPAHSDGWVKTEYNNQSSPSTFYTLGSEIELSRYDLTNRTKERLRYYVEQAVDNIFVSTNWNIDLAYAKSYPAATIKFEPLNWENETYGGKVPEDGAIVEIHFSIWVANEEDTTYTDEHPYAYAVMDTADEILDYLVTISGDIEERVGYNIQRIYDMTVDDAGSRKVSRSRAINIMIIKGKIRAKWLD